MARQIPASGDERLSLREWAEELTTLTARAGDSGVWIEYISPAGRLIANAFRPQVSEQMFQTLLQQQSPSDSANAYLELSLQEETAALYPPLRGDRGEIYLRAAIPHCNHSILGLVEYAEIRIATSLEFLTLVTNAALTA